MNICDVQKCAAYYQQYFMETFYIVSTYSGRSFILIGEKENFPHLVGIQKKTYKSNGYRKPGKLFYDIKMGANISSNIIPRTISTNSKMYKKMLNFRKSNDIFWKNEGPLAINYNEALSNSRLNNVDVLLSDIHKGFMLGWKKNKEIAINADIKLQKFCICSWIDELSGQQSKKEKYLPNQDVDIIRNVFAFDKNSDLIKHKFYTFDKKEKEYMLKMIARNSSNLLLDANNERHYTSIVENLDIHCKINGVQY
ncbi:MAG: PBECR4 domain-containing protein [Suipraeoptans sp.]